MRRALSVFLVLMLVLRGLLGDAMAMGQMAGGDVPTRAAIGAADSHADAAHTGNLIHTHASEPGALASNGAWAHGAPQAPALHDDASSVAAHCASGASGASHAPGDDSSAHTHCSACGVCHSPLVTWASASLTPIASTQAAPLAAPASFASATPAPVAKPPIA